MSTKNWTPINKKKSKKTQKLCKKSNHSKVLLIKDLSHIFAPLS